MGGSAFPALYTPRMPTEVMILVRDQVLDVLNKYYNKVQVPPEGPEKSDYGDIDVVVATPRDYLDCSPIDNGSMGGLVKALDAKAYISGGSSMHFAVRWPDRYLHLLPLDPQLSDEDIAKLKRVASVQVDVSFISDPKLFDWAIFLRSHGDFWPILGSVIRPFGLTSTPSGLLLRITELEQRAGSIEFKGGKEDYRVKLTHDPDEALRFLGISSREAPYVKDGTFATLGDMFSYISTCRFFDPTLQTLEHAGIEQHKKREWREYKKRRILQQWFESYIPENCMDGQKPRGTSATATTDEVQQEALIAFPEACKEFETKIREGLWTVHSQDFFTNLTNQLKPLVFENELSKANPMTLKPPTPPISTPISSASSISGKTSIATATAITDKPATKPKSKSVRFSTLPSPPASRASSISKFSMRTTSSSKRRSRSHVPSEIGSAPSRRLENVNNEVEKRLRVIRRGMKEELDEEMVAILQIFNAASPSPSPLPPSLTATTTTTLPSTSISTSSCSSSISSTSSSSTSTSTSMSSPSSPPPLTQHHWATLAHTVLQPRLTSLCTSVLDRWPSIEQRQLHQDKTKYFDFLKVKRNLGFGSSSGSSSSSSISSRRNISDSSRGSRQKAQKDGTAMLPVLRQVPAPAPPKTKLASPSPLQQAAPGRRLK